MRKGSAVPALLFGLRTQFYRFPLLQSENSLLHTRDFNPQLLLILEGERGYHNGGHYAASPFSAPSERAVKSGRDHLTSTTSKPNDAQN